MLFSTTNTLEGFIIKKYLGIVYRYSFTDKLYNNEDAIVGLTEAAEELGANAVIGVHMNPCCTTNIDDGLEYPTPDLISYGTAVIVEPINYL